MLRQVILLSITLDLDPNLSILVTFNSLTIWLYKAIKMCAAIVHSYI